MQFSILNAKQPVGNSEVVAISRISAFLKANGIRQLHYDGNVMSSFDMNDLLLVPPNSPIRLSQAVVSEHGQSKWNREVIQYIWRLQKEKYGVYNENITMNRIATTTAIMINEAIETKGTPFYCIQEVQRGEQTMMEMEIAFIGDSLAETNAFYQSLLANIVNAPLYYHRIPTHFSWASAAIAFRGVNGEKLGAVGYVRDEILRASEYMGFRSHEGVCMLGLPLKTLRTLISNGV